MAMITPWAMSAAVDTDEPTFPDRMAAAVALYPVNGLEELRDEVVP